MCSLGGPSLFQVDLGLICGLLELLGCVEGNRAVGNMKHIQGWQTCTCQVLCGSFGSPGSFGIIWGSIVADIHCRGALSAR